MNIKTFEIGSIITRNKKSYAFCDRSYIGDRFELLYYKDCLIVLDHERYGKMVLDDEEWGDGWCLYPEEVMKTNNAPQKEGS